MNELDFLKKLRKERKIELVEGSDEIKLAYLLKSENCLKSARLLFQNKLYENATSEAYYCMYNSLLALFFKIGIKSENHSSSIILFNELFDEKYLLNLISFGKEERIDKQYYVEAHQLTKITEHSCAEIIKNSENFLIKMKVLISELNTEKISLVRKKFNSLFE